MKKFITDLLRKILQKVDPEVPIVVLPVEIVEVPASAQIEPQKAEPVKSLAKVTEKKEKKAKVSTPPVARLSPQEIAARDMTEIMEVPFLALSKNRREPIIYEKHHNPNNMIKVKVSRHTGHFLASIYDWDIVLFVAGKMQEVLNKGSDIPPRTMIFPRHEIFKALGKHNGKKQEKDLEASLARLKLTGIETTIRNEDYRYKGGFGFLDSWGYTERQDVKEIHITLSHWLYDGICTKGSLLKVESDYFNLTSGLKRFLYRTARKHTGGHGNVLEFSIEKLYEKSGSEREFRKFKSDLKKAVLQDDIPGYSLNWIERNKESFVSFKNLRRLPLH